MDEVLEEDEEEEEEEEEPKAKAAKGGSRTGSYGSRKGEGVEEEGSTIWGYIRAVRLLPLQILLSGVIMGIHSHPTLFHVQSGIISEEQLKIWDHLDAAEATCKVIGGGGQEVARVSSFGLLLGP